MKKIDTDRKLKCYIACGYGQLGVITADGVIHFDIVQNVTNNIKNEEIRIARQYALNICREKVKYTTWCRTGYDYAKCLQTTIPKVLLSIFVVRKYVAHAGALSFKRSSKRILAEF